MDGEGQGEKRQGGNGDTGTCGMSHTVCGTGTSQPHWHDPKNARHELRPAGNAREDEACPFGSISRNLSEEGKGGNERAFLLGERCQHAKSMVFAQSMSSCYGLYANILKSYLPCIIRRWTHKFCHVFPWHNASPLS